MTTLHDKTTGLFKLDTRPDGSIELQYANSSVPVAVMVYNGTATRAVAEMIRDNVNEHSALVAVAEAAKILLAHHRVADLRKLHSDTLDPRFEALDRALRESGVQS